MPIISCTEFFSVFVFATATQESQVFVHRTYKNFVKYLHKEDLEKKYLQNILQLHVLFSY